MPEISYKTKFVKAFGVVSLFCVGASGVEAETWRLEPTLHTAAYVSDNIDRTNVGKSVGGIFLVRPGVKLVGKGRRLAVDLDYALDAALFAGSDFGNQLTHNLDATSTLELLKEHLYVDAGASVSQVTVSGSGRLSEGSLTPKQENIDTEYSYYVSPYWVQRFDSLANGMLRLGFEDTLYDDNFGADNESYTIDANLSSGRDFQMFRWNYRYHREESHRNAIKNRITGYSLGSLSYYLSSQFYLQGQVGKELNSYSFGDSDSVYWYGGFGWRPSRRTFLSVLYGDRSFGDSYQVTFKHVFRRLSVDLNYAESVESGVNSRLETRIGSTTDENGVQVLEPITGRAIYIGPYINKSGVLRVNYQQRRTLWTAEMYWRSRDFQVGTEFDETIYGTKLAVQRQIRRDIQGDAYVRYQNSKFDDLSNTFNHFYVGQVALTKDLYKNTKVSVGYLFSRQGSNKAANRYLENRVYTSMDILF